MDKSQRIQQELDHRERFLALTREQRIARAKALLKEITGK